MGFPNLVFIAAAK